MTVVTATILSAGRAMDPTYELVSIDVVKQVNRIPYAQLILLDGDLAQRRFAISDDNFFAPGNTVEIKLRYEGAPKEETTVFKGLIVGEGVETGNQRSLLTIELKDPAVKLAATRKSAIYRNVADSQVIGDIIGHSGLQRGTIPATRGQHKELVQYYCTDWDFLLARAEANGLLVVADNGMLSLAGSEVRGQPKYAFAYGISEIYSFEMAADVRRQVGDVQSIAWDIKNQAPTKAAKARNVQPAQGNFNARSIAGIVGSATTVLTSAVPLEPQELQAWADATMARSRLSLLRGRLGIPGMGAVKLLDVIEISGVSKHFNGQTLVTGLRHRVDRQGWQTDIQFGLAADSLAGRQDVVDAPAAGLLPAVNGLQIGIVDQFETDPDKEYRVKVHLASLDRNQGAVWARLAAPDAGKGRGYFFRPEAGDEVLVGFLNDDPRQAVILGGLYSSKNAPPSEVAQLTKENKKKALVTRSGTTIGFVDDSKSSIFIQTPDKNKILLDDDAKAIKITDQHGNMITMNQDGIEIKSAKDLKIEATGKVEIKGQSVDVK